MQGRYDELLGQLRGALGSGGGSSAASLAALDGICAGLQGLLAGLRIPQQARGCLWGCAPVQWWHGDG